MSDAQKTMKYFVTLPDEEGVMFGPEGPLLQIPQKMEEGVVIQQAKTVEFQTDLSGIIRIPADEYQDRSLNAMKMLQSRFYKTGPKRILGPFESDAEALVAQDVARPKSAEELLVTESAKSKVLESEVSTLKAKLAALEAREGGKEKKS